MLKTQKDIGMICWKVFESLSILRRQYIFENDIEELKELTLVVIPYESYVTSLRRVS